jgi:putative addiction module component (TIGR02574 family)
MSRSVHALAIEALDLEPGERLRLATELIDSVEGVEDPSWGAAWSEELDRRVKQAEQTGNHGRSWDEVRRDLLARLAAR